MIQVGDLIKLSTGVWYKVLGDNDKLYTVISSAGVNNTIRVKEGTVVNHLKCHDLPYCKRLMGIRTSNGVFKGVAVGEVFKCSGAVSGWLRKLEAGNGKYVAVSLDSGRAYVYNDINDNTAVNSVVSYDYWLTNNLWEEGGD